MTTRFTSKSASSFSFRSKARAGWSSSPAHNSSSSLARRGRYSMQVGRSSPHVAWKLTSAGGLSAKREDSGFRGPSTGRTGRRRENGGAVPNSDYVTLHAVLLVPYQHVRSRSRRHESRTSLAVNSR